MAYTAGTAANYKDLLAVLATFAAANGWVVLEQTTDKLFMKGIGLAGIDEIYVGVETYEDQANNYYNWSMVGSWGWRPGRTLDRQPRSSREAGYYVAAHFWNNPIPYWMVATPRRIILVAKVSTTYQHVHLGLLTVPATEAQYPYPLFIGGGKGSSNDSPLRMNYSGSLGSYWSSYGSGNASGRLAYPGGSWGVMSGGNNNDSIPAVATMTFNEPNRNAMLTALDGSYLTEPIYVVSTNNTGVLGTFDGLYRVTGYNNSSENIVTVNGVNHMVFQDGSRTGYGDYCALRMS
ncbi:MAG: hypothetical protein LBD10_07495 [Desulfobulbus sp.]|jgi:hypothetical protein|uniref:hypothetical protein n=1 Tax=Desulfobulbus sp. TaxID=895 RepID=UPI00283ED570|nr:hypothetical protein [Desulfobulbus sp.]MDR2550022.1 hypothetical protein [Desulfobulbus sp.]